MSRSSTSVTHALALASLVALIACASAPSRPSDTTSVEPWPSDSAASEDAVVHTQSRDGGDNGDTLVNTDTEMGAVNTTTCVVPAVTVAASVSAVAPPNVVLSEAVATGDCSGDTAACPVVTYHLAAWIDLANVSYNKTVELRYRAAPSDAWSTASATYVGPGNHGREVWYAETPAIDLPVAQVAQFEMSLLYTVAGVTYTDDGPYALAVQGPGSEAILVAAAPVTLVSAVLDDAGTLTGSVAVRGGSSGAGSLAIVFSTDEWSQMQSALGAFAGAVTGTDVGIWTFHVPLSEPFERVVFAVSYSDGGAPVWDNNFGRNHARYPSLGGFAGRWDISVTSPSRTFPSWFEVSNECGRARGRLVGRVGSVRPIRDIDLVGGTLSVALPTQYESQQGSLAFAATQSGGGLTGTCSSDDGPATFTAVAAPALLPTTPTPVWSDPISLMPASSAGLSLAGWTTRDGSPPSNWQLEGDTLVSTQVGADLVSALTVSDFQLHFEFNLPASGNSGVFLRGRYEVQLTDDDGLAPSTLRVGAIYGFLSPMVNAGMPAGQWQSCDVTLRGRQVTLVLNGVTVIQGQDIPGITGGALDSNEGTPGPIVLQGDHTPVSFRNVSLRTLVQR